MAASHFEAKVKSVLSGDTVVLHNISNPKQERILSLAFVTAPRLKREGDEQFAFESRDYLRRLLVGKVVRFQVLYKIPTGANREYGIVALPDRTVLPEQAVAEGWLKLRDDAGRKGDSEEDAQILEKLQVLEARARADSKGLWAETGGRINSMNELSNPQQFVEENKGQELTGESSLRISKTNTDSTQLSSRRFSPATASSFASSSRPPSTSRL